MARIDGEDDLTDSVGIGDPRHVIGDETALRDRYRPARQAVLDKARPKIDLAAARFVALSPLMVLATTSRTGADASPRGGRPGFVTVLDEHHLAFGDLSGNNRLDSYSNIVEHLRSGSSSSCLASKRPCASTAAPASPPIRVCSPARPSTGCT